MSGDLRPLYRFVEIIRALRDPQTGCPWDLKQTHASLKPYLIEEAYELLDAIDAGDDGKTKEELGDVLLQVALHAQIAGERGAFTIDDVASAITDKMVRRHPHVFGADTAETADDVVRKWSEIKQRESQGQSKPSALDGVPLSMPALPRAHQLGAKAGQQNFDWRSAEDVWQKVEEEFSELRDEMTGYDPNDETAASRREHELGDLLFILAQLARWLGTDAESCLRKACGRFEARFRRLEDSLGSAGLQQASDEQLESAWQQAKRELADEPASK